MMSETRSLSDLGRFGLTEYILEKCREAGASGRNSDDDAILLTEEETLSTSVLFSGSTDLIYTLFNTSVTRSLLLLSQISLQ